MKPQPKIKPRLMWARVGPKGDIVGSPNRIKKKVAAIWGPWDVTRVLVGMPPRRKRKNVKR